MPKRKAGSLSQSVRVLSPSELNGKSSGEPYFITHLLAPERNHDCYFHMGEILNGGFIIRVGAVKQMLLAHSAYFRSILHEDKKSEIEIIPAYDLAPPTVKNLLRYIYGYDNTDSLSFNETNGLFYAADKFVLDTLRNSLAVRLSSMLNHENVCILLSNPALAQQLSIKSSINKILQNETEKVLSNPSFMDINVDVFVKILEQETLKIPEIDLWRAAIKWATKRVGSKDGRALRTELETPLQYIRLCSLNAVDLCKEVIPTGVLTDTEVRLVTTSVGLGKKQNDLTSICNEIKLREGPKEVKCSNTHVAVFPGLNKPKPHTKLMSMHIITKDHTLELLPFEFTAKQCPIPYAAGEGDMFECQCTIQVVNELTEATTYVGFRKRIKYGETFLVPIQFKGKTVRLSPNSEYLLKMNFTQPIWYYSTLNASSFSNQHLEVKFRTQGDGWYLSPINRLTYKCVTE